MNRRGFANRLFCPECKTRVTCPHCNVGMVMHTTSGQSVCHYCHTRINTPSRCPNLTCNAELVRFGMGTQQVEDALTRMFPDQRIVRVDSDTMKHRSQYEELIRRFETREIDALVGTQMIAKGLDFPFVSLVGVVHADVSAFSSDFRANERLFQLITQVAGRAGRADVAGRVVVQTVTPDLPAFSFALTHDYESFAEAELMSREAIGLPPFRRLARIVVSDPSDALARHETESLADRIRAAIEAVGLSHADVWGPTPCALARLRGQYRHEVIIRTANATDLRQFMSHLQSSQSLKTKADGTIIDVDPVSMA
jgi:primosomal protein N' (replication factor Y)